MEGKIMLSNNTFLLSPLISNNTPKAKYMTPKMTIPITSILDPNTNGAIICNIPVNNNKRALIF
jgi:hypothetical protein